MSTAAQEGTAVTEGTETPPAETPRGTEGTNTATQETPKEGAPETPSEKPTEQKPTEPEFDAAAFEKLTAENARLARAVDRLSKRRTAEHEARQAKPEPKPTPTRKPSADPELSGLQQMEGEDGETLYRVHGMWVNGEFAKHELGRDAELAEYRQEREARADAEAAAETERAVGAVLEATGEAVKEGCKLAFPGLEGKMLDRATQMLGQSTSATLDAALTDGEDLTPDLVARTAASEIKGMREIVSHLVALQTNDNKQYEEEHKVKPEGPPVVPAGEKLEDMPREKRGRLMDQIAARAKAATRAALGGSSE